MTDFWALEEGGGGLDGFTGVIDEAYFSEGEYGVSLMIRTKFDDPENYPRFEDGCYTRYFSVGKGWTTKDGGDTIVHDAGDNKRFNKSSKIGVLVGQMGSVSAIRETLADFNPYQAKDWKGLHLQWGQVPVEKRRRVKDEHGIDTDKWESYPATELLPVGIGGSSSNGAAPAGFDLSTLKDVDMATLIGVAHLADNDKAFMEAVIGNTALATNASLMGAMSKNLSGLVAALKAEVL